jgi:hypothetical protein
LDDYYVYNPSLYHVSPDSGLDTAVQESETWHGEFGFLFALEYDFNQQTYGTTIGKE